MPILPGPAGNARVTFDVILQAIENQLVADGVINADQVVWARPDAGQIFFDQFIVWLVPGHGQHEGRDGGSQQLMMRRTVEILHRVTQGPELSSHTATEWQTIVKTYFTAEFTMADSIINSVGDDGFWPEVNDGSGSLLTIEPIKLVQDKPPSRAALKNLLAEYVCTLSCLYFPYADPSRGIFPIP